EVLDALAAGAAAVGGEVGLLDVPGQGGARQRQGGADEGVGQGGGRGQHGRGGGQLQGARQALADLLVDARVAQDHPGQVVTVVQRPADGDDAAPVVADGDHRAADRQGVGQQGQVGD